MGAIVCWQCSKEIAEASERKYILCPFCGYPILGKGDIRGILLSLCNPGDPIIHNMDEPGGYMSPKEVADALDLHINTVLKHIHQGVLRASKVGRKWRIYSKDFEVYARGLES